MQLFENYSGITCNNPVVVIGAGSETVQRTMAMSLVGAFSVAVYESLPGANREDAVTTDTYNTGHAEN
ncbi:MAG: hypothetical protein ACYC1T_00205 [Sulfuricaulis sp.]